MSAFGTPVTQKNAGTTSGSTGLSVSTNTALNDLIVVFVSTNGNTPTGVTDTIGNTYTELTNNFTGDSNGVKQRSYWTQSIGANAANVITYGAPNATPVCLFASNVPCTLPGVVKDVDDSIGSNSFTLATTTTAAFTTTGTDEIVFIFLEMSNHAADTVVAVGGNTVTGTTPPVASTSGGGVAYQLFASAQVGITEALTTSNAGVNMVATISIGAFKAPPTFIVSGALGALGAAATVQYSGTLNGQVTADGSGNYSIPGLPNGTYTIRPIKTGFQFAPVSSLQTVNNANIPNVNFVTTVFVAKGDLGPGYDFKFKF